MNLDLDGRIERLEVQNITIIERIWELTSRLIKLEQLLKNHIILCPNNLGKFGQDTETLNPEELSLRLSAVAFELNNMLPAVANAVRRKDNLNRDSESTVLNESIRNNLANVDDAERQLIGEQGKKISSPLLTNSNLSSQGQDSKEKIRTGNSKKKGKGDNSSGPGVQASGCGSVNHNDVKVQNEKTPADTTVVSNDCAIIQNLKTLPFPLSSSSTSKEVVKGDTIANGPKSAHSSLPFSGEIHVDQKSKDGSAPSAGDLTHSLKITLGSMPIQSQNQDQHQTTPLANQEVPVQPAKVYYHVNPWGEDDELIAWEGDDNIKLDQDVEIEALQDFNLETDNKKFATAIELPTSDIPESESSVCQNTLPGSGFNRISPSSSSLISPAVSTMSIPGSTASKSSATTSSSIPKVDKLFNDYMKRHTSPKSIRKDWLSQRFANVTESQKEEFLRAFSRHAVKQSTGIRLAAISHMMDVMLSANIVSQKAVIKCFSEGVISDLPQMYIGKGKKYDDVMTRLPFILVTIFNDTMKDLNWLVDLGKDFHATQPQIWFELGCEVIGIILERKKETGALKLWNQTGSGRAILEQAAVEVKLF